MRIRQNATYTIIDNKGASKEYSLIEQGKKVITFELIENPGEIFQGHSLDKEKWTFLGFNGEKYTIQKKEKARATGSKIGKDALTGAQVKELEGMIRIAAGLNKIISFKIEESGKEWVISIKPFKERAPKDEKPIKAAFRTKAQKMASMKK